MAYTPRTNQVPGAGKFLPYVLDSTGTATQVVGPPAGQKICDLVIASAGYYELQVTAGLGIGAAGNQDMANMALFVAATKIASIPTISVAAGGGPPAMLRFVVTVAANDTVSVRASQAATGTAVYVAGIVATPYYTGSQ